MKQLTAAELRRQFTNAYSACIQSVIAAMGSAGLRRVKLDYGLFSPRCHNVHDTDGSSDTVTALEQTEEDGLVAIGSEGTRYPLGTDIDGQDNHTLTLPYFMAEIVIDKADELKSLLLHRAPSMKKSELLPVIRAFMGTGREAKFGGEGPTVMKGTVKITGMDATTFTGTFHDDAAGNEKEIHMALSELSKKDLETVIDAINDLIREDYQKLNY